MNPIGQIAALVGALTYLAVLSSTQVLGARAQTRRERRLAGRR